jgi:hypothetical protein
MRYWTQVLSAGSITINETDGVTALTIQANSSSSCQISGNLSFKGLNSQSVILENGESWTTTSPTNTPIDGLTITWVSGTIDLLIQV